MNRQQIAQITADRLTQWGKECTDAHSTPVLLLAIGHDAHTGELHICVPKSIPTDEIRYWLVHAIKLLDQPGGAAGAD